MRTLLHFVAILALVPFALVGLFILAMILAPIVGAPLPEFPIWETLVFLLLPS